MAGSRWQPQAEDEPTELGGASELEGFASEKSHFQSVDSLRNRRKRGRGSSDFGGFGVRPLWVKVRGIFTGPDLFLQHICFISRCPTSVIHLSIKTQQGAVRAEASGRGEGGAPQEARRGQPLPAPPLRQARLIESEPGGVKKAAIN